MVNDIRNWRIDDPAPGIPLSSISPISSRAWTLLVRSKHNALLQDHFLQIAGAVTILKGLDYHHARFMSITESLAREEQTDEAQLLPEAVAYVNRVGQFYYLACSDLVKSHLGAVIVPKIDELMHFRHKHTAHRSIDKPYAIDDPQIQDVHAMSLGEFGGQLWLPKQPSPPGFPGSFWGRAHRVFHMHTGQLHKGSHEIYELVIERDHSEVMDEAYGVLGKFLCGVQLQRRKPANPALHRTRQKAARR